MEETRWEKIKKVLKMPYFWVLILSIPAIIWVIYMNEVRPKGSITESITTWGNEIITGVRNGIPNVGLNKRDIEDAVKDGGATEEELEVLKAILNGEAEEEDDGK